MGSCVDESCLFPGTHFCGTSSRNPKGPQWGKGVLGIYTGIYTWVRPLEFESRECHVDQNPTQTMNAHALLSAHPILVRWSILKNYMKSFHKSMETSFDCIKFHFGKDLYAKLWPEMLWSQRLFFLPEKVVRNPIFAIKYLTSLFFFPLNSAKEKPKVFCTVFCISQIQGI